MHRFVLILLALPAAAQPADRGEFLSSYCAPCHNQRTRTADLALDSLDPAKPEAQAEVWERVIARLRAGSMPPPGVRRPDRAAYGAMVAALEADLDRAWATAPKPGRIHAVHRLNRAEYNNTIRDLFALDIDVQPLLPGDETADGSFDNFADVLSVSTAHLERYLSVARQVTRLAVGLPPASPALDTFEVPLHVVQEDRQSEDLPPGSRGGLAIRYAFPVDGEYLIRVRLQRQYQDYLKGIGWQQRVEIRLDGKLLRRFPVGGAAQGRPAGASYAGDGEPGYAGDAEWERYMQVSGDAGLEVRVPAKAGSRLVSVAFVREMFEPEGLPQPLQRGRVITNDQVYMDHANVGSVQIGGPYQVARTSADTPSRRAIFVCRPAGVSGERACAQRILARLARLAWRRPVNGGDVQGLLPFFDQGRQEGGSFDAGVQFALERLLVDPEFLLRVYRDPSPRPRGPYALSGIELASRLSFFLWSSVPDDALLRLGETGRLTEPATTEAEVRRMLADPRAVQALTGNFAAQWLNLRRVAEVVVDPERYPNYDLSLMQAFQKETELFLASTLREDRPVSELLDANYTFLNERLARHYGIEGVTGSRFRRVTLPDPRKRGGLLAQGALLATTSYPDRTSPVLRGKWLLNNLFGLHTPAPPAGVDTNLETKPGVRPASIRERLAQHRANPSCNSCHVVIDPLGFALENFDVIGGWRTRDELGHPVDTDGVTASGEPVQGLTGLRALLLSDRERFPRTVTEKLMAYALGRPLQHSDQPAVRAIVREAAAREYRWSALITGIVQSPAFRMREPRAAAP